MIDYKNTPEGKEVSRIYADILPLSRPEPSHAHPRMSKLNRAKIFSPFAALRGYEEEIAAEGLEHLKVVKIELSEEDKGKLSDKLLQKSDAERHLHGVLATPCRRASDTSPP